MNKYQTELRQHSTDCFVWGVRTAEDGVYIGRGETVTRPIALWQTEQAIANHEETSAKARVQSFVDFAQKRLAEIEGDAKLKELPALLMAKPDLELAVDQESLRTEQAVILATLKLLGH